MSDTLHDDVREIRGLLNTLVAGQARTDQKIDGLNARLYNNGSGAIPVLFEQVAAQKAAVEVCKTEIKSVAGKVIEQRAWVVGLSTGMALAIQGARMGIVKLFHL